MKTTYLQIRIEPELKLRLLQHVENTQPQFSSVSHFVTLLVSQHLKNNEHTEPNIIRYEDGTRLHWRGPGWYASRQEGSHENEHVCTYWVGKENEQPDTSEMYLGTPRWLPVIPFEPGARCDVAV